MSFKPHGTFNKITIDDQNKNFFKTTSGILDKISATPRGLKLLNTLNTLKNGKQLAISPTDQGNSCVSPFRGRFVKLRQAFNGEVTYPLPLELKNALTESEKNGITKEILAQLITGGTSIVTGVASGNVNSPVPSTKVPIAGSAAALGNLSRIDKILNGDLSPQAACTPISPGTYSFADKIIRILQPWLDPGEGANCQIKFNPKGEVSCVGDNKMAKRPPAIGLGHELIDAWYNLTGRRIFDDYMSCGLIDDEIMTTGLPPYQYGEFSENWLRAGWSSRLDIRMGYL